MADIFDAHRFLDGDMTPEEQSAFTTALESSPATKAELESVQIIKSTLQSQCAGLEDPVLWKACQERLRAIEKTRRVENFVGRNSFQFAAGLFAFIVIAGVLQKQLPHSSAIQANEVTSLASSVTPSTFGGDFSGWLRSKVGEAPIETDNGLQPIRAFEGFSNGKRFASIDFMDVSGVVSLLVVPGKSGIEGMSESFDGRYKVGSMNGRTCVSWSKDSYVFVVYGDRDSIQLIAVADKLRR